MKHYILKQIILSASFLLYLTSCSNDIELGMPPKDNIAPAAPVVPNIDNLNGAAVISYEIPPDRDLLYLKATYK